MNKIKIQRKRPTIKYSGSLICQNYGEELSHGVLVWDVKKRSAKFHEIENDIAYATIEVEDGKIKTSKKYVQSLPKKLRLRIKYTNTNYLQLQEIIKKFKTRHTLLETTTTKITNENSLEDRHTDILGDVRDVEYQNKLITDHIQNKHVGIAPEDVDGIRHINRLMNTRLRSDNVIVRNVIWKPRLFEFSNMFSYGPNNVINLEKLSGIQGIFAANASGKSSLFDAITFCLFDKCSRSGKAVDIMNNRKNNFKCKITFEIDDEIYQIERIAEKHKVTGNVKVNVNFGKYNNGVYENLNGGSRDQTNIIIRGYIGTYDDFLLTALSTQNDNKNFIFENQRERKNLLNSFLDIGIFEELYIVTKNEIGSKQIQLKLLQSEIADRTIAELSEQIAENKSKYDESKIIHDLYETKISDNLRESKLKSSQIKYIDEIIDINKVITQLDVIKSEIVVCKEKTSTLTKQLKDYKSTYQKLVKRQEKYDYELFMKAQREIAELKHNIMLHENVIDKETHKLEHHQAQVDNLSKHEFDPNCQYCVNNDFVKSAMNSKELIPEIEAIIAKEQYNISELQSMIKDKEVILKDLDDYYEISAALDELGKEWNPKIDEDKSNTDRLEKIVQLRIDLTEKKTRFKKQEYIQTQNEKLKIEIDLLEDEYSNLNRELKKSSNVSLELHTILTKLQTEHDQLIQKNSKLYELYTEVHQYEVYLDAISKNGVPYSLIQKIIPIIESEVNSILNQIVEFSVKLTADDKNINCYIQYNDLEEYPVEMSSGMERFIISFAMRVALVNISSLPRPNFLAIDEGFGVADAENLNLMQILFNYLRTEFDFVVIISHLDTIRDFVDASINVNKSASGYSEIKYI